MDNSESINNSLQHLCLFYSEPKSFKQIALECQFLESFTVIGQNVENLEGIQKLRNLEELWLVDCNLKQEVRDFVIMFCLCLLLQELLKSGCLTLDTLITNIIKYFLLEV